MPKEPYITGKEPYISPERDLLTRVLLQRRLVVEQAARLISARVTSLSAGLPAA